MRAAQAFVATRFHWRMATIDVGSGSGRRALNHELTLVPFIDFLLCIVAFLLVTAVWSDMARLPTSARAPGQASMAPEAPQAELHVDMRRDGRFVLEWRLGSTVLVQDEIARRAETAPSGVLRYPALAGEVARLWAAHGAHRSPLDAERDRAVLHTGNGAEFEEIVAAMDAIHATSRATPHGAPASAFDVVFAVD
jgi:biopolymer transport protein ExbD